jgi:hypothetical protein
MKVWDKDPDGQPCINTTPVGKRIPDDGIIWAYEASGFYRMPSSDVVWSRSMIEEFGGCLDDDESINPEPSPSRLIPWLSRHSLSYDVDGAVTTRVSDDICEDGSSRAVPLAEVCRTKYVPHRQNPDIYSLRKMSKMLHSYKSSLQHTIFQRSSSSMTLTPTLAPLEVQHQPAQQNTYALFLQ